MLSIALSIYLMYLFEDLTYEEVKNFSTEVVIDQLTSGFIDPYTVLYGFVVFVIEKIN